MTRISAEAPLILLLGICAASLLTLLAALMAYEREDPATTDANIAFENEEFERALGEYERVSEELPKRPEPDYNAANAQYKLEEYEKAEEQLYKALQDAYDVDEETLPDNLAASTQFNLGNVLFQMGEYRAAVDQYRAAIDQYRAAIEQYKEVLRRNPDDRQAKHNLELALSKIEEVEEEEEQQQQQQQQDEQQQGQGDQPGSPDQPDDEGDEEQEGPDGDREGVGEDPEGEQRGDGSEQESQETERPGPNPQQQMTPSQARQFLDAVGNNTQTLQNYMQQQQFLSPRAMPERDW